LLRHRDNLAPNIIGVIRSRRMRWVGRVECIERFQMITLWSKTLKGGLNVDGANIKFNLKDIMHEDVEWLQLAQGRVWWRAVLATVMSVLVLYNNTDCQLLEESVDS
jgi:hypothetical protein